MRKAAGKIKEKRHAPLVPPRGVPETVNLRSFVPEDGRIAIERWQELRTILHVSIILHVRIILHARTILHAY